MSKQSCSTWDIHYFQWANPFKGLGFPRYLRGLTAVFFHHGCPERTKDSHMALHHNTSPFTPAATASTVSRMSGVGSSYRTIDSKLFAPLIDLGIDIKARWAGSDKRAALIGSLEGTTCLLDYCLKTLSYFGARIDWLMSSTTSTMGA